MISLVFVILILLANKPVTSQLTNFEAYFLNPAMSVRTEIKIYYDSNYGRLGRNMTLVFDSNDFIIQPGIGSGCSYLQYASFMMTCFATNREEDKKWQFTIRGDDVDLPTLGKTNLTITNVNTLNRASKMKGTLYYTFNETLMTVEFIIIVEGKYDSPIILNNLKDPVKRENTKVNYLIESKYSLAYSLDIVMDFPKYSFYDQTVYSIDYFNHNGDVNFQPTLIEPSGLGPNARIEVLNEESLKIKGALPNGVVQNKKYSFIISNILCPEVVNKQGFTVKLTDEFNGVPFMNYYNLSIETPGSINVLSFTKNETRINRGFSFNITLQTDDYITKNADIEVLFPQDISLLGARVGCLLNCEKYIMPRQLDRLVHALNPDATAIVGLDFVKVSQSKEVIHSFNIKGIVLARSTKPVVMNISITSENNDMMYMIPGGIRLDATKGDITDITVDISDYHINAEGDVLISMTNSDPIIKGDKIEILFCKAFTMPDLPLGNCPSTLLGIAATSMCQIANNNVTITHLTETTINKATAISFIVPNVKNPGMVLNCPISVTIKTEDEWIINENAEELSFEFLPGSFASLSVTVDDQVNSAITNYLFTIGNTHPIETSGAFEIAFPNEISIDPSVTCQNGFECRVSGQTIKAVTTSPIANTRVSMTISGIQNPRSLKPANKLTIKSISSEGYLIATYNEEITITNASPLVIDDWSVEPKSIIANSECTYLFSIVVKEKLFKGDVVIIDIPGDVGIVNIGKGVQLLGKGKLVYNLPNTLQSNTEGNGYILRFDIQFNSNNIKYILKGETLSFEVLGLRNPDSSKPTKSFRSSVKDITSYLIMESRADLRLTLQPSLLTTVSLFPIVPGNQISDYSIYFKPTIALNTLDKLVLVYPEEVTEVSDHCSPENQDLIPSMTVLHDGVNRKLTFTLTLKDNSFSDYVKIECKAWRSVIPEGRGSTSPFQLYTTTQDDYIKEKSPSDLIVSFDCLYPCATCVEGSKTQCTKCLPNSINTILIDGKCHKECPDNYSEDPTTKTCVKCSPTCHKCLYDDPSKCTSCAGSFQYFDEEAKTCVADCPLNQYPNDNNSCKDCSANCKTCESISSKCTSCKIDERYPFMYNNVCYEACPENTMSQSSYSCIECASTCKTCSDKPSNCISCHSPSILLNKQCVNISECKPDMNYYPDTINGVCLKCQEGCQLCGKNVNECSQCKDTHIQKGAICHKIVNSCLNGFYLTSEKICEQCNTNLCLRCENSPITCTGCKSGLFLQQSSCIEQCSEGYLLHLNECLLKCPEGFIPIQNKCSDDIESAKDNYLLYVFPYKISGDFFLLLAFSLLFVVSVGIIKVFFKETLYFPCIIAFLSLSSFFNLILLFSYSFTSGEVKFFYPIAVIFILQKVLSYVFLLIYVFFCSNDKETIDWNQNHTVSFILLISSLLIIDYKIIRLFYSQFFHLKFFHVKRRTYQSIQRVYMISAIIELIVIDLPLIIMSLVIISLYKPYSFLYYLSIECIIMLGTLYLLMIIDLLLFSNWDNALGTRKKSTIKAIPKLNLKEKAVEGNEVSEIDSNAITGVNKILNSQNDRQTSKDQSSRILCSVNRPPSRNLERGMINTNSIETEQKKTHDSNDMNKYMYTMIENQATERDFALNVQPLKRKSIQNGKELYRISQIVKSTDPNDIDHSMLKEDKKDTANPKRKSIASKSAKLNTSMIDLDDIKVSSVSKDYHVSEELNNSVINNNVN